MNLYVITLRKSIKDPSYKYLTRVVNFSCMHNDQG
jgi:hypothetical protein